MTAEILGVIAYGAMIAAAAIIMLGRGGKD